MTDSRAMTPLRFRFDSLGADRTRKNHLLETFTITIKHLSCLILTEVPACYSPSVFFVRGKQRQRYHKHHRHEGKA